MKNVKMLTGLLLVDAPASALNNAGIDKSQRDLNAVTVKKIRYRGGEEYPYVSGQAFKRWWRDTIHKKFVWSPSSITREEKVAYTEADPILHEEDDIFGYMLAPKEKIVQLNLVPKLSYRRIAPLKCTPLVSIFSGTVQKADFGVFARSDETQAEPTPFEQEFYSTVLKGAFSLMLSEIGIFAMGRAKDLPGVDDAIQVWSGKKDEKAEAQIAAFKKKVETIIQSAKSKGAAVNNTSIILPIEERKKRAKEVLLPLSELSGGAKGATYLTDVAPRFVIASVLNCANHIFMDVVKTNGTKPTLDTAVLNEIVKDYQNHFESPIYIGLRKGFFDEKEYEQISQMKEINAGEKKISVIFGTPHQTLEKLAKYVESMETL
ncbi:MAG: type I-B CRISPR-associated protein Cas7/Cst2/DevR [Candidatus Bathyarchaeota archaeon]|jgi:CRISPR-associated protein Cst2|nr:type I-B CRISPR-associated protein Cas7/Cst2/DevR [Candidatus Bathyarchaeota archaeon]